MVSRFRFLFVVLVLSASGPFWSGCNRETSDPEFTEGKGPDTGPDKVRGEIDAFRYRIRGYYNSSNFDALEKSVAEVRAGSPLFRDGAWKIYHFYSSLRCREDEPESMWQLHDRIHKGWITAKPDSITARIAHADFLTEYAWHARGSGDAKTVSKDGWKLFGERLAAAHEILKQAKPMQPQCPMWWSVSMRVGLGQGWSHAEYGKLYAEAKSVFPKYYYYDLSLAYYLLPRWHGKAGDWEKAAAAEMQRTEGLGAEGYAMTVSHMRGYYDNVFRETQASWPNTRAGFDQMRQKYPDSLEIITAYFQLACYAGDRPLAQKLLALLNGYVDERSWNRKSDFDRARDWALTGK